MDLTHTKKLAHKFRVAKDPSTTLSQCRIVLLSLPIMDKLVFAWFLSGGKVVLIFYKSISNIM